MKYYTEPERNITNSMNAAMIDAGENDSKYKILDVYQNQQQ
jgi:hypothetical protein